MKTPETKEVDHFDAKERAAILICADLYEENKRDLAYVSRVDGELVRSVVVKNGHRFELKNGELGLMLTKLKEWGFLSLVPVNGDWVFRIEIKAVEYKRQIQAKRKFKNRIILIGSAIGTAATILTGVVKFWEEIRKHF